MVGSLVRDRLIDTGKILQRPEILGHRAESRIENALFDLIEIPGIARRIIGLSPLHAVKGKARLRYVSRKSGDLRFQKFFAKTV